MLRRPDRILMKVFPQCLLLSGLLLLPLSASLGSPPASGIVPFARQQIQIAVSVRPTLRVQQQTKSKGRTRAFCVWSNEPIPKYDVKLELQRGQVISRSQLAVAIGDIECSSHNSTASLFRTLETWNDNAQIPSVATLIISPH